MENEKEIKKNQKRNEKEMKKKHKKFELTEIGHGLIFILVVGTILSVAMLFMSIVQNQKAVETVSIESFHGSENGEFRLCIVLDPDGNENRYVFYCFNEDGGRTLRFCDVESTVIYETLSDEEVPYAEIITRGDKKAHEEVRLYLPANGFVLEEITSLNE